MVKCEMCRKFNDYGKVGQRTLVYYITIDELNDEILGEARENYGVGIRIKETGEEVNIHGITICKSSAGHLLDLLASNFVTPIALNDVICDWIG